MIKLILSLGIFWKPWPYCNICGWEVDGGWPYAKLINPVKDDINSYFKNFKKHKAVKLTPKIANGKASFSAPLLIALSLSPLPKTNINYNPHYLYQTR